jgi:hypothetical protein
MTVDGELYSIRMKYEELQRKADLYKAMLVSVAEGKTKPEDLHAFRRQEQIGIRYDEEE